MLGVILWGSRRRNILKGASSIFKMIRCPVLTGTSRRHIEAYSNPNLTTWVDDYSEFYTVPFLHVAVELTASCCVIKQSNLGQRIATSENALIRIL
jgi:glutaredoxin-related protein